MCVCVRVYLCCAFNAYNNSLAIRTYCCFRCFDSLRCPQHLMSLPYAHIHSIGLDIYSYINAYCTQYILLFGATHSRKRHIINVKIDYETENRKTVVSHNYYHLNRCMLFVWMLCVTRQHRRNWKDGNIHHTSTLNGCRQFDCCQFRCVTFDACDKSELQAAEPIEATSSKHVKPLNSKDQRKIYWNRCNSCRHNTNVTRKKRSCFLSVNKEFIWCVNCKAIELIIFFLIRFYIFGILRYWLFGRRVVKYFVSRMYLVEFHWNLSLTYILNYQCKFVQFYFGYDDCTTNSSPHKWTECHIPKYSYKKWRKIETDPPWTTNWVKT